MIERAVVGLGNPGKKYRNTKHNIGFLSLDTYAKIKKIKFKKSIKFNCEIAEYKNSLLIKPKTFMNRSGYTIEKIVSFYKLSIDNILVIHDDLDLPLAKLKLKVKGGSAGHNGIKSIISHLSSDNFKRLRVGIDKNLSYDSKDYVLQDFNKHEQSEINEVLNIITNIIDGYIEETKFEDLMNIYN